jgi:hypothetical protein
LWWKLTDSIKYFDLNWVKLDNYHMYVLKMKMRWHQTVSLKLFGLDQNRTSFQNIILLYWNMSKMVWFWTTEGLKYGFCKKLLLYEWNSGHLDTFFTKLDSPVIKTLETHFFTRESKGPFLYYVRVFLAFSRPPTHPCKE